MKRSKPTKLPLAKQTVKPLTPAELRDVEGARQPPSQCSYDYSGCINGCH